MAQSPPYLFSYACFTCRKSFKRPYVRDRLAMKCPHCSGEADNVGRKFKPPKRTDEKQWQKVEFLVSHGFPFHSVVVDGERVPYPRTLAEARAFVAEYKAWAKPTRLHELQLQPTRRADDSPR